MFTFGYLFSRMSWLNKCFHRYFSQYLSLYEVFNVHSLRKAKPLEVSSKLLYQSTFISNAFGSGQLHSFMFLTEWRWRDSNSWPPACKAGALPTELHPHLDFYSIQRLSPMGLSGLEPPTSRLSGVRSNRLSYKPISIWQPPAFPYRHQYSIIGRFRLNHRVRDVDGCFPKAHRHQKYPELYCPKQSARFRSASSRCAASPHLRFQTQSLVSKLTVFSFVRYIASHYYHINN